MNKPAFAAIRSHSLTKPVLIFVSSRRQTRLTALDLTSIATAEEARSPGFLQHAQSDAARNRDAERRLCHVFLITRWYNRPLFVSQTSHMFLRAEEGEVATWVAKIKDASLRHTIQARPRASSPDV